jgi:hypothetical protein
MNNNGELISKDEFEKMRKAYASKHPKGTQSIVFSAAKVRELLEGASGLKIYFGKNDLGQTTLMLTPVNDSGAALTTTTTEPPILDRGQLCPPNCG